MDGINGPVTIDGLVQDAKTAGYQLTQRAVRDWTAKGLIDVPQRRPAGKGRGSHAALYPEQQRRLLLALLHHRDQGVRTRGLAQIPVSIWLYWGDEFVPLRQARTALATWLGDPRSSKRQAGETARQMLTQFDHPGASAADRKRLVDLVADAAYTGRIDLKALESALRAVFEPGFGPFDRAIGHPSTPLTVESHIELTTARLRASAALHAGTLTDDDFRTARTAHLLTFVQYQREQPLLATQDPPGQPGFYEPATAQTAVNRACDGLLAVLGLGLMHPQRAAQFAALPTPVVNLTI